MDLKLFFEILNGNYEKIPKEKSKVVRIFLSSTFSDTHTERDYLIAHVYPKLKEFCKKEHNLDFQILDMRWGIASDVTNTHMATSICLNEIDICKNTSIGLNFISLLSHRYGSRGLPTKIVDKEYMLLLNELEKQSDLDTSFEYQYENKKYTIENIFKECYELDTNSKPARFRLKFLDRLFENMNLKTPEFYQLWNSLETKLGQLIRGLVSYCYNHKIIDQTQYERYFVSVTEKEVFNGILKVKNPNNNVLYFEREIEGLEENIEENPSLAGKFIDLNKNKQIDTDAKNLLERLKYEKIRPCLNKANITKFTVKWDKEHGISLKTHREYIEEFGNVFYEKVKALINKNQVKEYSGDALNQFDQNLIREVLDHARFCKVKVSQFHGREELLTQLKTYILESSYQPFVIYGGSGCGKTAVLAKIADEIKRFVPDPENYVIILRFLGTTPSTSSVYSLFASIIYQLMRIFNYRPEWLRNMGEMNYYEVLLRSMKSHVILNDLFREFIYGIAEKFPHKKIVLILDSIDQLPKTAYSLEWLLDTLPKNVKIIYSTIPKLNDVDILRIMSKKVLINETNLAEVSSLDMDLAENILKDWLAKARRSISETQWSILNTLLVKSVLFPLYVKLIFDIISKWSSFTEPSDEFKKCLNIDACIKYLFQCFEKDHGKLLFSRSIIYMSSFANGISENEIEDILSLDDDVLYDIFEFHAPPVRKLPISLWSRIKYDLGGYLVEKEVDDTRVIYWYHRRFIEVAESYYITKLNKDVFLNVIDFFNETWKHKPKPYKYNEFVAKKKKITNATELEECRDSTIQPTMYVDKDGNKKYNLRKINEFPEFISKLKANLALPLCLEHVFLNHTFLMGLFQAKTTSEILSLHEKFKENSYSLSGVAKEAYNEFFILKFIFLQCAFTMGECSSSASSQLVQRMLFFYSDSKFIKSFIDQYDKEAYKTCSLIVPYQAFQPALSEVFFTYEKHIKPIYQATIYGDDDCFVMTLSNKLIVFSMQNLNEIGEVKIDNVDGQLDYFIFYFDDEPDDDATLKDFEGGFITASKNVVWSYSFQGLNYFRKEFAPLEINDLKMITPNHIVIAFSSQNYLEVYNLFTAELVLHKIFDEKIKFIATHRFDMYRYNFEWSQLMICFDSGLIEVFEIKHTANLEDNNNNEKSLIKNSDNCLEFVPYYKMSKLSFNCTAFNMNLEKDELFIATEDGSCAILNIESFKVSYSKFMVDSENKFSINSIEEVTSDCVILKSTEGDLYVGRLKSEDNLVPNKVAKIKGPFQRAIFIQNFMELGIIIAAFNKGLVSYFSINFEEDSIRILHLRDKQIHFDDVTYVFRKDQMILTTSLDSKLKVDICNTHINNLEIDFDRSEAKITKISLLNEYSVISHGDNTNVLNLWDLSNGKIFSQINLDPDEIVTDHFFTNELYVVSEKKTNADARSFLIIRGYRLKLKYKKDSVKKTQTHQFKVKILKQKDIKILNIPNSDDLLILNEFKEKLSIELFKLEFHKRVEYQDSETLERVGVICLESLGAINILQNKPKITYNSNFLAISFGLKIVLIDTSNCVILTQHVVTNQTNSLTYFLSPTNLMSNNFLELKSIPNTDNLIALDNLNNLTYINYNKKTKCVKVLKDDSLIVDSFQIYTNLLIAYSKDDKKLICFDLDEFLKHSAKNPFHKLFFQLKLDPNILVLNHYGIGSDGKNIFTVTNDNRLCLYRLHDLSKIAEVLVYSNVIDVLCSGEFICMTMEDRRILSYMICDPDDQQAEIRIKKLDSRKSSVDEKQKTKVKKIFEKLIDLDASSDEADDELFEIIYEADDKKFELKTNELNADNNNDSDESKMDNQILIDKYKELRNKISTCNPIQVFKTELNKEDFIDNWQIDLLKKNNLMGNHEQKLIKIQEKITDSYNSEFEGSYDEEIDNFKNELVKKRTSKSGLFRNAGRTIITENNLGNASTACLIQ